MLERLHRFAVNMRIRQLERELAHWDDTIAKEQARYAAHDSLISTWRTECQLIEDRISALRFQRRLTFSRATGEYTAKPVTGRGNAKAS